MHVLVVAFNFPPAGSSGTYRALALANASASLGHKTTVLTCDENFWYLSRLDLGLLNHIDSRISIKQAPFHGGPYDRVINRWSANQAQDYSTWLEQFNNTTFEFPEPAFASWIEPVTDEVLKLHNSDPVDLTIATGNPYASYCAATTLYSTYSVPYILDDRDAWMFDVVSGEVRDDIEKIEQILAPWIANSLECWFVNPEISNWYQNRFQTPPGKIATVENGWDSLFINPQTIAHGRSKTTETAPVFSYIGVISGKLPLTQIVDGWEIAKNSGLPAASELRLYGPIGYYKETSIHNEALEKGKELGVKVLGEVSKTEVQIAYEESDVLVLAREGGKFVTSGKVYEYTATGLPIVTAIPTDHDAHRVLANYPRTHKVNADAVANLDPSDIAAALESAWQDALAADSDLIAKSVAVGQEFERSQRLRIALDRVTKKAGSSC